jgi:hypothetical protein
MHPRACGLNGEADFHKIPLSKTQEVAMPSKESIIKPTTQQQEYNNQRALFDAQPSMLQRYFEVQAHSLAEMLLQKHSQVRFTLPDRVVIDRVTGNTETIPPEEREQTAGHLLDRLTGKELTIVVRAKFKEMEQLPKRAVAVAAGVMRYSTCRYMVSSMLPSGRSVKYHLLEGEESPSEPDASSEDAESAITAATDAIAEESAGDTKRGTLQVPFVPYARRFFLPQWVAFDGDGKLLSGSAAEAEADIASMQQFLQVLHTAVGLAAYYVADEEYHRKRYGILGQLINQGRALAKYQCREIIQTIQHRASSGNLNRGLSISLPYFDDQSLRMKNYPFEIIPAGRIMFVPAFVVRAACEESVKVAQDTRLSPSTRNHILSELALLEEAFQSSKE